MTARGKRPKFECACTGPTPIFKANWDADFDGRRSLSESVFHEELDFSQPFVFVEHFNDEALYAVQK